MEIKRSLQDYADIINRPHHVSSRHPQMSLADRAAQFSPFAALTGHDAAIKETVRLTEGKIILSEDMQEELERKWQMLAERVREQPEITVTFFVPDERKEGGHYETITGKLKKIDFYGRDIILADSRRIPLENISELEAVSDNI